MGLRYLRRPPRPAVRNEAGGKSRHGVAAQKEPPAQVVEVMPGECVEMARALAYFCVACGREHASGDIRCRDVAVAEADIIETIKRAQ